MTNWRDRLRKTAENSEKVELPEPEKKDFAAMWISAMLTLWLPAVLILILFCALVSLPFWLL